MELNGGTRKLKQRKEKRNEGRRERANSYNIKK
jgi:hypothetical protein